MVPFLTEGDLFLPHFLMFSSLAFDDLASYMYGSLNQLHLLEIDFRPRKKNKVLAAISDKNSCLYPERSYDCLIEKKC
jgi:hypothetical protein